MAKLSDTLSRLERQILELPLSANDVPAQLNAMANIITEFLPSNLEMSTTAAIFSAMDLYISTAHKDRDKQWYAEYFALKVLAYIKTVNLRLEAHELGEQIEPNTLISDLLNIHCYLSGVGIVIRDSTATRDPRQQRLVNMIERQEWLFRKFKDGEYTFPLNKNSRQSLHKEYNEKYEKKKLGDKTFQRDLTAIKNRFPKTDKNS